MEIVLAEEMGFCFGVRRAINMMQKKAQSGPVQSLGTIVHNSQVAERLSEIGVNVIENLDHADDRLLAITSHGVGPEIIESAKTKGLAIVDTTCPFVRKAQLAAKALASAGFKVCVFGDPDHPEVKGILGWSAGRGFAGTDPQEALQHLRGCGRVGVVSQTTQRQEKLSYFVRALTEALLPAVSELRVINTICDATSARQEAALDLTNLVEAVVVIGGKNSSNTQRLAEICSARGIKTFLIETVDDLEPRWFEGLQKVGLTAGTSTPDWVIEEVVNALRSIETAPAQG